MVGTGGLAAIVSGTRLRAAVAAAASDATATVDRVGLWHLLRAVRCLRPQIRLTALFCTMVFRGVFAQG